MGSTTNFRQRKSQHRRSCTNSNSKKYSYPLYKFIRGNSGWDNFEMIEIEKYPCMDSNEARSRERFHYEQLNASLNRVRPLVTKNELLQETKERKQTEYYKEYNKKYCKKYKEEHKDSIQKSSTKYYNENKDILNAKKREYNKTNKEYNKEYNKKYKEEHKDVINAKQREKFTCSCGSIISRGGKSKHEKTFIHISKTQTLFHNQDEIHA